MEDLGGIEHSEYRKYLLASIPPEFYPISVLEKLQNTSILLAGTGTVGGQAGLTLAELGAENITAADPELVEYGNLGRQPFLVSDAVCKRNKAVSFKDFIKCKVNPFAIIKPVIEGVTAANVVSLVSDAEIVIDGIEATNIEPILRLHQEACKQKKVVIMGIDVAGTAMVVVYDYRKNGRPFNGKLDDLWSMFEEHIDKLHKGKVTPAEQEEIAYLLTTRIVPVNLVPIEQLIEIANRKPGKDKIPQLPGTASTLGALIANTVIAILAGRTPRSEIAIDTFQAVSTRNPKDLEQRRMEIMNQVLNQLGAN